MEINIGGNIKRLRTEAHATQEELANHLSLSCQAVSKWENGVTTPDIYLLPGIAEFFGVTIDELFVPDAGGYRNRAEQLAVLFEYRGTKENFDKAEAEYTKLFAEGKETAEDMFEYGYINQQRARKLNKIAEDYFKKSLEAGYLNAEAQLLHHIAGQGRHKEVIDKYEKKVKDDPGSIRNLRLLISAYGGHYADGPDPEKAFAIALEGLERFPGDASLLSMCGDLCRGLKNMMKRLIITSDRSKSTPTWAIIITAWHSCTPT